MNFSSNKPSHLRALLKKNFILWKRSWCISLLELLVPVLLASFMMGFRSASPTEDIPTKTYFTQPAPSSFTYNGLLNPDYIKNCKANEGGGLVGIVPVPVVGTLEYDVNQALGK